MVFKRRLDPMSSMHMLSISGSLEVWFAKERNDLGWLCLMILNWSSFRWSVFIIPKRPPLNQIGVSRGFSDALKMHWRFGCHSCEEATKFSITH